MSQQISPFLEAAYGWNFGEGGWNTGMDYNLLKFSFMFDRNVDSVVGALPPAVNGEAHYLTSDNRLYFAVGTTYFSTVVPKWFEFKERSTGKTYQFNGGSAVEISSPTEIDSRLEAVELTVASLGSAAFQDASDFITPAQLDVAEAQAASYTDELRNDLLDPLLGSGIVLHETGVTVRDKFDAIDAQANLSLHVQNSPFNAVADGVTDDAVAIQAALDYASANGIGYVYLGPTHLIASTVSIPAGVTLIGQGRNCKIVPSASGTYTSGYLFFFNSVDGVNWSTPFPNAGSGGLESVTFWNGDTPAVPIVSPLRGIRAWGGFDAKNLRGRNMTKMVSRPTGFYSDLVTIDGVYCEPVIGDEFQVDIRGLGDCVRVSRLQMGWSGFNPGNGVAKALYIAGALAGEVDNCITGDMTFQGTTVSVSNCHLEQSQIATDGANLSIRSTYMSPLDRPPVLLDDTSGHRSTVSLENCEFVYSIGLFEYQGADIRLNTSVNLEIRNCYRRITRNSALSRCQLHGIAVEDGAGIGLTNWNKYSYELSRSGRIYAGNVVERSFTINPGAASFTGLTAAAAEAGDTWVGSTGTYYYTSQLVYDTGRQIGRNQTFAELSIVATNAGAGVRLLASFSGKPTSGVLRIYRGTSPGVYDQFVEIPIYAAYLFYDIGDRINGVSWVARAAGPVTAVNGIGEAGLTVNGDNVVVRAAGVPTTGAWVAGDDIYLTAPTAAGKRARTCVTSGSPGTFKAWGVIDA